MIIQCWFCLEWTCSPRDLQESYPTLQFKNINSFGAQPSLWSNYHIPTWLREKTMALTRWIFVSKVMSLLFNMLSRFLSFSSKKQASFNFMAAVTVCSDFGAQEINSATVFTFAPSICHKVMGPDAMILVFWMLSLKPAFWLSSFTLICGWNSSFSFLPMERHQGCF